MSNYPTKAHYDDEGRDDYSTASIQPMQDVGPRRRSAVIDTSEELGGQLEKLSMLVAQLRDRLTPVLRLEGHGEAVNKLAGVDPNADSPHVGQLRRHASTVRQIQADLGVLLSSLDV